MSRFTPFLLGIALMVVFVGSPSNARAESASEHVAEFQAGLIGVMERAEKLGVSGRYKTLEPIIGQTFNLPLMAALSAGQHWKTASIDQKRRLVTAFKRMSVATLATLFDGYGGERFEILGEQSGPQNTVLVKTQLVFPDGNDPVTFSYVARQAQDGWRLIDVILEGQISELKVRISEYRTTLKKGGVEALIKLLNGKADELLS